MGFTLGDILYSSMLFTNAIGNQISLNLKSHSLAILSEDRFLSRGLNYF